MFQFRCLRAAALASGLAGVAMANTCPTHVYKLMPGQDTVTTIDTMTTEGSPCGADVAGKFFFDDSDTTAYYCDGNQWRTLEAKNSGAADPSNRAKPQIIQVKATGDRTVSSNSWETNTNYVQSVTLTEEMYVYITYAINVQTTSNAGMVSARLNIAGEADSFTPTWENKTPHIHGYVQGTALRLLGAGTHIIKIEWKATSEWMNPTFGGRGGGQMVIMALPKWMVTVAEEVTLSTETDVPHGTYKTTMWEKTMDLSEDTILLGTYDGVWGGGEATYLRLKWFANDYMDERGLLLQQGTTIGGYFESMRTFTTRRVAAQSGYKIGVLGSGNSKVYGAHFGTRAVLLGIKADIGAMGLQRDWVLPLGGVYSIPKYDAGTGNSLSKAEVTNVGQNTLEIEQQRIEPNLVGAKRFMFLQLGFVNCDTATTGDAWVQSWLYVNQDQEQGGLWYTEPQRPGMGGGVDQLLPSMRGGEIGAGQHEFTRYWTGSNGARLMRFAQSHTQRHGVFIVPIV